MRIYKLTVFEKNGEKVIDESFEAIDDAAAKKHGEEILSKKEAINKTHRCASSSGKLLLFHP